VGKLDFEIDGITNSIENALTHESVETEVLPVVTADLKKILKKNGWCFNWRPEFKEEDRELFKLVVKGCSIVEGLISLQPMVNHIEMQLIETAPHNFGRTKKWIGVPGNMVAFACKMSFEKGFEGSVAFKAKTLLIQHYTTTLGAQLIYKNRMSISGNAAKKLVNSYYKNLFYERK
jgi:hypothetical protein